MLQSPLAQPTNVLNAYFARMSRRNKLQKFAAVAAFPHVYESFDVGADKLLCAGEEVVMRGRWAEGHFRNDHPVTLELACGKGEYTVGLAARYPQRNVIGVDIKGARIWKGARHALAAHLDNAAFLRTRIEYLDRFFNPGEVDEIWIVFPDPFPRDSKVNRRLTAPGFIDIYRKLLKPGGLVHLKTDDPTLYDYSLDVIRSIDDCTLLYHSGDIYASDLVAPELGIKTFYEVQHLAEGRTIRYIRFAIGTQE